MRKIAVLAAAACSSLFAVAPASAEPVFLTSYYANGWSLRIDGSVTKDGDQAYSIELNLSGTCPSAQMLSTPKMGVRYRSPREDWHTEMFPCGTIPGPVQGSGYLFPGDSVAIQAIGEGGFPASAGYGFEVQVRPAEPETAPETAPTPSL
ncbi:hypothetical protein GCM10027445_11850 [Amycolatopsis endophytica]|uniref:Uncharacterized protein n=1 Tax=Amycolatopsis endophytica TaxID=860233 RepID=A0A853B3A4_9PSEU|nr:hypothetical protein [Amycolatopsis endophytica]NYI89322.1 hypothetical protein [Amycolatopsis endophytica]